MNKVVFFTNDVELTSIINNAQNIGTGKLVSDVGIPKLLDIYEKYGAQCTFFVTGDYAKAFPQSIRQIHSKGHEIGSHGAAHGHDDAFDTMPLNEQKKNLKSSKQILEDIVGEEVISFRAPALRVNSDTPKALIESGFKIDSSVASQRFDFFFSFGSKEKTKWLTAPRHPYFCDVDSLAKKGKSPLLEIPLIAAIYPYIGTTLRISPLLTRFFRNVLYIESKYCSRYPVFLIHPNELIQEERDENIWSRRSNSLFSYLVKEKFRSFLKTMNLGDNAYRLFEQELGFFQNKGYRGITLKEYYYRMENKNE